MNTSLNLEFAAAALLHDVPHIIKRLELPDSLKELPVKNWFSDTELLSYLLEYHIQNDLTSHPLTQHRIAAEIIAQAENLSLGATVTAPGELSPMKSFFQTISEGKDNTNHNELFFQTSELGEDILLDLHQSKKELYFAPSYVVSSFLDDFSTLLTSVHRPNLNTIYYLFKKYFWSFALSRHGTDFSFSVYDHGKLTCALACALYLFLQENHKTIFVSQNIRIIRDTLADPVEERFIFLKISITHPESRETEQQTVSATERYTAKSVLLWAAQDILSKFGLFDCSIFSVHPTHMVLLLPNLSSKNIPEIIHALNAQLFYTFGVNWLISHQSTVLKNNDLTQHMSSHTNCASIYWEKILPAANTGDFFTPKFYTEHYESIFQPKQCEHLGLSTSDALSTDLTRLIVSACSGSASPLFVTEDIAQKPINDSKDMHAYFFKLNPYDAALSTHGHFRSTSSIPDFYLLKAAQGHNLTIDLTIMHQNYESYSSTHPNITQLYAVLSQIEFFMQYQLRKKINSSDGTSLLWAANTHISFTLDNPCDLGKCVETIYAEYHRFFNNSPIISLVARVNFGDKTPQNPVKLPLNTLQDNCLFAGEMIPWNVLLQLLSTAEDISSEVKTYSTSVQQTLFTGLKRFADYDTLQNSAIPNDIQTLLQSIHNSRLMAKWIRHLLKREFKNEH